MFKVITRRPNGDEVVELGSYRDFNEALIVAQTLEHEIKVGEAMVWDDRNGKNDIWWGAHERNEAHRQQVADYIEWSKRAGVSDWYRVANGMKDPETLRRLAELLEEEQRRFAVLCPED